MYNIRIQLVCLLLGLSSVAFSNVKDTTVIQTQQNELNNFYIENDGSVSQIKQNVNDSISSIILGGVVSGVTDTAAVEPEGQVVFFSKERKADVVKDSMAEGGVLISEAVEVKNIDTSAVIASYAVPIPIAAGLKSTTNTHSDSLTLSAGRAGDYVVKNDKVPDRDSLEAAKLEAENESEDDDYEGYTPSYRRKSSYKNLEEATLASDRLLAQLKKKQSQKDQAGSKSGSLSSRVIRGGDYVRTTAKSDNGSNNISRNSNDKNFDYETDFGNEPTYYINGVRVEKAEVLKLRQKNILSRTMKLNDTASRNPNGEIWFEVK